MGKHEGDDKEKYEEFKPDKGHSQDGEGKGGGSREKPPSDGKK